MIKGLLLHILRLVLLISCIHARNQLINRNLYFFIISGNFRQEGWNPELLVLYFHARFVEAANWRKGKIGVAERKKQLRKFVENKRVFLVKNMWFFTESFATSSHATTWCWICFVGRTKWALFGWCWLWRMNRKQREKVAKTPFLPRLLSVVTSLALYYTVNRSPFLTSSR